MKLRPLPFLFLAVAIPLGAEEPKPTPIPIRDLGTKFELTGALGIPLGKRVTIEGVLVTGPGKTEANNAHLRVQRLDGEAVQKRICIRLAATHWDDAFLFEGMENGPVTKGTTVQLIGFETGGYRGRPLEIEKELEAPPPAAKKPESTTEGELRIAYSNDYIFVGSDQGTFGFSFDSEFMACSGKAIPAISFSPADLESRGGVLEGTALSKSGQAFMAGTGWSVLINAAAPWPEDVEGRPIQTDGRYSKDSAQNPYMLEHGTWHLIQLEDQIGKTVELRGRPCCVNDHWWFRYRGTDLLVEGMEHLPGWTGELDGVPVVIHGILAKEKHLPADPHDDWEKRALESGYVVKKPSWTPLSGDLLHAEE